MKFTYKEMKKLDKQCLEELYTDVDWSAYTKDTDMLQQSVENSLYVLTAWHDDELIGLIRVVGDGLSIIFIQDLLVKNAYHNQKIGSELMQSVLKKYADVRQKVLLTEEAPNTRYFYEKNGFKSCDQGVAVAFAQLKA
ncbi:GNAT family N-acetyltransferase [Oceanobacillus jeddahense]|uniref:GNAT family N-acetyltransferase n=1 Tax=Oceanobacillus jeddahense TaxID=1462527 RepID=A0ABY5JR40_9BACI|nr:GNAT family N-acetyltransferase [Oceanobacillus jeddahense]UUI02760.1 GNAT family N-acetyltransferase [Oceanobacillus jeddahense]